LPVAFLVIVVAVALACSQPSPSLKETVALTPPALNTVSQPEGSATGTPPQATESEAVPAIEQPTQGGAPETEAQLTASAIAAAHDRVMSGIYERTVPSVVGLRVLKSITIGGAVPGMPQGDFPSRAAGSGFVWDDEGHIVTNKHVIDGADRIIVVLSDGIQVDAELVGDDPDSDLAVIKITDESVRPPAISLGDSDTIKPGQLAVAIGDPFYRGFSMTSGIISAVGRTINPSDSNFSVPRVVQHDAATNPGNSGGPLLNRQGSVVGINTQIISETGGFSGVGLAIPVNLAKLVAPSLIAEGRYEYPFIGIRGVSVSPDIAQAMGLPADMRGALVIAVGTGTAAEEAGLRASDRLTVINGAELPIGGDIIVAMNGTPTMGMDDVVAHTVEQTQPGDIVEFTIMRDGEEMTMEVTMGARPE
jgi:2-alkenal reductase